VTRHGQISNDKGLGVRLAPVLKMGKDGSRRWAAPGGSWHGDYDNNLLLA
jgi:hypothetical protein